MALGYNAISIKTNRGEGKLFYYLRGYKNSTKKHV